MTNQHPAPSTESQTCQHPEVKPCTGKTKMGCFRGSQKRIQKITPRCQTSLLRAVLFTKILPQTQDRKSFFYFQDLFVHAKSSKKDDSKIKAPCDCCPSHWFQFQSISTVSSLGSDICFSWSLSDSEFPSASWMERDAKKEIQRFIHHPKNTSKGIFYQKNFTSKKI